MINKKSLFLIGTLFLLVACATVEQIGREALKSTPEGRRVLKQWTVC